MAIRHFLLRAGAHSVGAVQDGTHLIVVIDDRAAGVYELLLPRVDTRATGSLWPARLRRHLRYAADGDANGRCEPECRSFYEAVAKTLRGAERVLIVFGSAPGARGAVNELIVELRLRHAGLARRVAGTMTVDEHIPTEGKCWLPSASDDPSVPAAHAPVRITVSRRGATDGLRNRTALPVAS